MTTGQERGEKSAAIAAWKDLLNDSKSLLERPGFRHRFLLQEAHSLFNARTIDSDDLSDLLELADGALAYAVEEKCYQ